VKPDTVCGILANKSRCSGIARSARSQKFFRLCPITEKFKPNRSKSGMAVDPVSLNDYLTNRCLIVRRGMITVTWSLLFRVYFRVKRQTDDGGIGFGKNISMRFMWNGTEARVV
jgi:hypothetical protein